MEIISYISSSDWFTHYIFNPTMGIPFILWVILVGGAISFVYLVLKKIIW